MSSGSFDAEDVHYPRHHRDEEQTTPSTPGVSAAGSQLSTPLMSQQAKIASVLNTPPTTSLKNGDDNTPAIFGGNQYDRLSPPAWVPPDAEEVEWTDNWNQTHDNQHHYMQPGVPGDDSTIGSSNSSFNNNVGLHAPQLLRPRGFSISSYVDDLSIGNTSCPQQQQGRAHHKRNPSLPVSFFSSVKPQQGSNHQLYQEMHKHYINSLQSTTQTTPYELHSHHNISQIQADAAMAGLKGVLLDLYVVDRSVDSSTAKMMATKSGSEKEHDIFFRKEEAKAPPTQKPRKTSLGTLNDIQCILELHKVDKTVDRFKQDLQMPEFFEEEAWESGVWKDLRRIDVEMEGHARKKQSKEGREIEAEDDVQEADQIQYQFDLSGDEEERGWGNSSLGGEGIYQSTEALLTDYDAYQFFDPHETEALHANSYQSSHVSASINDDLRELIDLLQTDVEVDGASRRHKEMEMIMPLLEVDQMMNKRKEQSKVKDMWNEDLKALYMTDLEVDGAVRKYAPEPVKKEPQKSSADSLECKPSSSDVVSTTAPSAADQEVKDVLSQHLPQVSQQNYCPTSPELMATKSSFHGSNLSLPPPPPPMPSPQVTRRAIFSSNERRKSSPSMSKPTSAQQKRSIFSSQEKLSAASQCAFQRGDMIPGTTAVVAKGGEMIGDIPVGKVVATDASGTAIR